MNRQPKAHNKMRNLALVLVTCVFIGSLEALNEREAMDDYSDHPCIRPCEEGGEAKTCGYDWTLELYYTLSNACYRCPFNLTDCARPHCVAADGQSRGVLTANRIIPGPQIQVCEGDQIVVNVRNMMETSAGVTIHWHGLSMKGSQYMDGTEFVTQCPVNPRSTFQYRFRASEPGTYWWHSHAGLQRSDGLFGHLVVRQKPSRDPHSALYDYDLPEHVMSVTDWLVDMTRRSFSSHHHNEVDDEPASMLINGKGAFHEFTEPLTGRKTYAPYAEFTVKAAMRYRFRVISAATMNCPIQFSVDSHALMVIASDGKDFEPIVVDSFIVNTGERFDFVLVTHDTANPDNHWIRATGLADCSVKRAHQVAVLRYEGAPPGLPGRNTSFEAGERQGITLNPLNAKGTALLIPVDRLNCTAEDDDWLTREPDKKFYLSMDFTAVDNFQFQEPELYPLNAIVEDRQLLSPQINHISFTLPPVPTLTQFRDINEEEQFCNAQNVQVDCKKEYCECTHRLKVEVGDVVEFVIVNEGLKSEANHPMHLHGYTFRLVGMDRLNESTTLEEVKALDRSGQLNRKLTRAPLKDTVAVPDGGYTIVRFKADNPGVWLFHCHIEFHNIAGMALLVQVGEASQFPKRPKHFPICGDWRFTGLEEDELGGRHDDDDDDDDDNKPCTNSADARISQASLVLWMVLCLGFVLGIC